MTENRNLGWVSVSFEMVMVQTRHMHLVMIAYSLLMSQLKTDSAKEWALNKLTTIGEACRAILNETLRETLNWAIEQIVVKARKREYVMEKLGIG